MQEIDCVVYDIEIINCIPDKGRPLDPALTYCKGWGDHLGMGVGCLCAIDTRDGIPRVFLQDNLDQFFRLIENRCVAGHSNHEFDDRIVTAHGGVISRSYDLLRKLRKAVGEPEGYLRGLTKAGRKVDDLARVNLANLQKSEDGAMAPVLWQRGEHGRVIDYCLRDVTIEYRLILRIPTGIVDPVTGSAFQLEVPM